MQQESNLHSESIEKYIIKVMYNRPNTIVEIAQSLNPDDFFFGPLRYLFTAIKKLSVKGDVTPDGIMTLLESENTEGFNTLNNLGGSPTIEAELRDNSLPASPAVKDQISVLKSLSYRRNAMNTADIIKYLAQSNMDQERNRQFDSVEDLDNKIKEYVYGLTDTINTSENIKPIGESVSSLRDRIKNKEVVGIDIGEKFPQLNTMIKRLRDRALYVFGAPEKIGKSTLLLDIGWYVARTIGIPVAYGDTEMTTEEVLLRLCSKISGVTEDKIEEDDLTEDEEEVVDKAWAIIEETPFFHFNCNEMTNNELESQVKLLQLKHGIGLFIYDYVKIQSHEAEKGRTDLIMGAKVDTLKEKIAKQCHIPVITSGQMYPLHMVEGKQKFAETSHFTKLGDVICRLDLSDPKDPEAFGTHYIQLIAGRKVNRKSVGKRVYFDFDGDCHQIKEL